MRKHNIPILVLILLITTTSIVYANSGPTYWRGYPSLEVLSIDKNSPIEIENEKLIFDFSKEEYINKGDYSLSGLVTAIYKMKNPTNNQEKVQMAFPFISSLDHFNPEEIAIKSDGNNIPFQIYIGKDIKLKNRKNVETEENILDFNKILSSINKEVYSPSYYNLDDIGTLYKYDVRAIGEEVKIAIDYTIDYEKTKVISKGFNGGSIKDNTERIMSWVSDKEILEVFVLGEDIELGINAYIDGEMTQETDNYSYELTTEKVSIRDYLNKEVEAYKEQFVYNDYLAENQIFNLCAMTLDELIEKDVLNLWIDELFSISSLDRIFVLLYEIEFLPESSKDISVSYLTRGTMDSVETKKPLYSFEYLLNPASNWANFKDLSIEIKPPTEHPYILDSSLELVRSEDGTYTGEFESLPNEDFSFTLFSKEQITFMDKMERKLYYYLPIILPFIVASIVGFIFKAIYKRLKSQKNK
jgi:hypothetical protein